MFGPRVEEAPNQEVDFEWFPEDCRWSSSWLGTRRLRSIVQYCNQGPQVHGLWGKDQEKETFLSKRHQALCLKWAKEHESWTVDDWKNVVFSDENNINILGSDGVKYYWIRPGDKLQSHHLDLTVRHGGGSLMIWGCMTYRGIGYGCHIQEIMDSAVYIDILNTTFKDSLEYWGYKLDEIIFQHDNDPKHTSR